MDLTDKEITTAYKRYANAKAILDELNDVNDTNILSDYMSNDTKPMPRYLLLEINATEDLLAASLHDTFAECARAIDISETTGVSSVRVHDLDNLHHYEADRRVLGFNFLVNEGTQPDPAPDAQRVSIVPESLSSFQPGIVWLPQVKALQATTLALKDILGAADNGEAYDSDELHGSFLDDYNAGHAALEALGITEDEQ